VNLEGTRNALDAAEAAGCERFLMVSSIAVYGWQVRTSVCDEESTPREYGAGPYSRTKRASEELALDYHAFGRVPVTVVRPGNVWGPGSGLWVDEIVDFLRSGTNLLIDRGEGDAILAYVDNVVDVIALAAASPVAAGRVYNANDGSGVTWRQYFGDLARILGVEPPTRSVPPKVALAMAAAMERGWQVLGRSSRPLLTRDAVTILSARAAVPIRRAVEDLGYRPQVSYEQGLERVAAYVKGGSR
jgi:nucleoside-diphosphate-sugar epimerase